MRLNRHLNLDFLPFRNSDIFIQFDRLSVHDTAEGLCHALSSVSPQLLRDAFREAAGTTRK